MSDLVQLAETIAARIPGAASKFAVGELTVTVEAPRILDLLGYLHGEGEFKILVDLCGLDWPNRLPKRFDVVYHLLSLTRNQRIRVKVEVGEGEAIKSCIALYPAASWFERETFDMYGIGFQDHPDLRRILTDYGFSGHPLRKDFPLTGYVELRYDEELKRVVYQPVQLVQEFRDFDFMSPWEGAPHILPGDEKAAMAPNASSGDPGKKP
jgi:NADH-quinone oxidoreductase subunit C